MINKFNDFIKEMNSSNSTNDKIKVLRNCDRELQRILYYTYNNFMQYNITSKNLEKRKDLCNKDTKFDSIFNLLDSLNEKLITGHKAIEETNGFILKNPEFKNLLYLILNRNLKIRASVKLINKAHIGLIPTFNVALANKFNDFP